MIERGGLSRCGWQVCGAYILSEEELAKLGQENEEFEDDACLPTCGVEAPKNLSPFEQPHRMTVRISRKERPVKSKLPVSGVYDA